MPFQERIKKVAANFPGILDSDRLELLNAQLIGLQKKGFSKLVDNFLSNKNQYTIRPFLFEIYLCRWFLSQNKIKGIVYEPDDFERPPEFVFNIDDKPFQIEAKVITQFVNETVKKKLVSQIDRRIASKTNNVFEIWLSEDIEPKDVNKIVDWIADEGASLTIGNKKELIIEEETAAWIKAIYESNSGGKVGIEHVLGIADGLAQQIDTANIKDKIFSKIKKSNSKFKSRLGEDIYSFIFMTCDSNIFLSKETIQEALYGREAVVSYRDKDSKMQFKEILQDDGIWSKERYTNIDMIFFIKPGTDLLKDTFEPFIFPNPHNAEKIRKTPEPFGKMKIHLPPTMLGQSIFGY
ncbi:MAG: hypothetical protein SWH54_10780 [Thermodesulfobacteriota bacterium]|nr:hypothetical protein [Thermodesulfobacteriota bacterium]